MRAAAGFAGEPVFSDGLQERLSDVKQRDELLAAEAAMREWIMNLLGLDAAKLSDDEEKFILGQLRIRVQVRNGRAARCRRRREGRVRCLCRRTCRTLQRALPRVRSG
jgi:hypothetical protein